MEYVIKNAAVLLDDELQVTDVRIVDGYIDHIGNHLSAAQSVDMGGKILCPGYINIHIHGINGRDVLFTNEDDEDIPLIAQALRRHGVTGFLPTSVTAPIPVLHRAVSRTAHFMAYPTGGATVLGHHLEGPWINVKQAGSQPSEYILDPMFEDYDRIVGQYGHCVKLVTMATEMPGALPFIRALRERGVVVSIGHSDCTYQQAMAAFDAGVTGATHLFNSMPFIHHREPGCVAAALVDDRAWVEIIADLIHLHPGTMRLIMAAKPQNRIILVSDSIIATDLGDGDYSLGKMLIYIRNGQPRRINPDTYDGPLPDGTLAGSVLTLDRAVKNVVEILGEPLVDALHMASLNPARYIGEDGRRGRIHPGYIADMTILNTDLTVYDTIVNGERGRT